MAFILPSPLSARFVTYSTQPALVLELDFAGRAIMDFLQDR
jgi:hypothetical protein